MKIIELLGKEEGREFPEVYCHLCDNFSGNSWMLPLNKRSSLDPFHQGKRMVQSIMGGYATGFELHRPSIGSSPAWTATIYINGEKPNSGTCWDSCDIFFEIMEY